MLTNKQGTLFPYCLIQTQGTKQALATRKMRVKGSGRVPKSVHSPVISSTKKRSDIGVLALLSIYNTVMMSYDVEKLCGYIVHSLVQRVIKQRN